MKKMVFLLGVGAGFILGSRAGAGPYRELEQRARTVLHRPEVQATVENAKGAAKVQAAQAVQQVNERIASTVE